MAHSRLCYSKGSKCARGMPLHDSEGQPGVPRDHVLHARGRTGDLVRGHERRTASADGSE